MNSPMLTSTVKVQDAILLARSAKIYVTMLLPIPNLCPDRCVFTSRVTLPEISSAEGSFHNTGVEISPSIFTRISDGQSAIVGGIVSSVIKNNGDGDEDEDEDEHEHEDEHLMYVLLLIIVQVI